MAANCCLLDITDHGELYLASKPVSVHWRDLGARLGVLQNTLATIEVDCNGKVENCMSAMLEKWLRRPFGEVCDDVKPTWKSLCVALSHIDRALAERLAEEHDCGDISLSVSEGLSDDVPSPAFLPQMCGCGKCTVIGWRTGNACRNFLVSDFPKLLVIDPKNSSASLFKQSYDQHATLCQATSGIIEQFEVVVGDIWGQLFESVENHKVDIAKITRLLCIWLGIKLPMLLDLDSLQNLFHSLRVSWYNIRPLHLLVTRVLASKSPILLADWNSYLTRFKEYCSARNLKDYSDIFFRVEDHNIFLLEVDEHYHKFTLSDIEALCNSLSIALSCSSVCLHLVTVRRGSLIIYLYYSYSDYLSVFQSLTTEQLKLISQIKAYRILSLTDLHNQFRYDNIQSYAEAPPQRNVSTLSPKFEVFECTFGEKETDELCQGSSLKEGTEVLRKHSHIKDIELSRTQAELTVDVCTELKRKEESIVTSSEEMLRLKKQVHSVKELSRTQVELSVFHIELKREEEFVSLSEEMLKIKEQLHSMKELNISLSKELAEFKARPDSTSSKLQSLALRRFKGFKGKPVKTITGLNRPWGVAVCDNGDIVVAECGAHCVTIVNKEGKKVKSFRGTEETKEGQFTYPRGVAITNDKHILVTDEHRLQKLTFDGVCVQTVSSSGSGQLQFNYPRGIAVHPTTGLVFVADTRNDCIQVFNSYFTYAYSITLHGDNQLNKPYDVSLDSEGHLYIAEFGDHCITKLTTTGEYITRFGSRGIAPGQLYYPNSLTISNNLVYVSECGNNHRVSVFDTKGTFLHCFGERSGKKEFNKPFGIATDTVGNLYVSDRFNNRLVVF